MSRIRVIMPKMGMTMTEGSVASWEKHDGDHVNEGEVIAMVETDKITNSLESLSLIHILALSAPWRMPSISSGFPS